MRILFFKIQSVTTAENFLGTKAMSKTLLTLRVSRVKKGVPHQFSCSWEIYKNQTAGWEDIIKKQTIVHKF